MESDKLVRGSAGGLRHMQTGYVRTYAGWILLGGVLVVVVVSKRIISAAQRLGERHERYYI